MDLRKSKYIIPNLFTLTSAFMGLLAILWAATGTDLNMKRAAIAIVIAMLADMMDGRVARLTKTESNFGVQMDSLADAISFGVAPAAVAYLYGLNQIVWGEIPIGMVAVFVYMATGIMRLARFNITAGAASKPSQYFEGLPIPGGAAVVATLLWVSSDLGLARADISVILAITMPILGLLMVSRVRFISLKHVKWGWYKRAMALLAATSLVVLAVITKASFVLLGISVLYAFFCPIMNGFIFVKKRHTELKSKEDSD